MKESNYINRITNIFRTKIEKYTIIFNFLSVFIPFTILYIVFVYSPIGFVKDYLQLSSIENPNFIISVILGTLATTISITVAILILSFNTFKQRAGEYAISFFNSISALHYIISIYITSLMIIFISYIEISKTSSNFTLNLLYFNIYTFFLTITTIIFLSIKLFKKISLPELLKYYFLMVTKEEVEGSVYSYTDTDNLSNKTKKPLFILENIGLNYLKDGDFNIANIIFNGISTKLFIYIEEEKSTRFILYFDYFLKLANNFIPDAIHKGNYELLVGIWFWFSNLLEYAKLTQEQFQYFWFHYRLFSNKYYIKLHKYNLEEIGNKYFSTSAKMFKDSCDKYYLDEKDMDIFHHYFPKIHETLYGIKNEYNYFDEHDFLTINEPWNDFIKKYKMIFYDCGEYQLKMKNEHQLVLIIKEMSNHIKFKFEIKQPLKQLYLFQTFYPLIRELIDRGFSRNIFHHDMSDVVDGINPLKYTFIKTKIIYENHILNEYGNMLIFLQKYNLVDYGVVGGLSSGDLPIPGDLELLSHRYLRFLEKDPGDVKTISILVDIVIILSDNFEKDLDKNKELHFRLRENLINVEKSLSCIENLSIDGAKLLEKVKKKIKQMNILRKRIVKK